MAERRRPDVQCVRQTAARNVGGGREVSCEGLAEVLCHYHVPNAPARGIMSGGMKLVREHLYIVLLSTFLIVSCVVLYRGWRACDARGGHYVRGLFWMECILPPTR